MTDISGLLIVYALWELLWFIDNDVGLNGEYNRPPMGVLNYIRRRRWDSV